MRKIWSWNHRLESAGKAALLQGEEVLTGILRDWEHAGPHKPVF